MATAAQQGTRITTLSNGLTVATEENPSAGAATVGVYVGAGSRNESAQNNGAASFFEHLALQVNER
jgi:processing peptidase subunit beta